MSDWIVKGKAWKFGDFVNSESIAPSAYQSLEKKERAKHCLEHLDPEFPKNVQKNDIIVAGRSFAGSSGRPHAPIVLKDTGVGAVLVESSGRVFYRNAINAALPVFEISDITKKIDKGDDVEVNVTTGEVKDLTKGTTLHGQPPGGILLEIMQKGGLLNWIKARRHLYKTLEPQA